MAGKFPKSEITLKRRDLMLGMAAGGAGVAMGLPQVALAQSGSEEIIRSHGYSFFGDLQYPQNFTHFD